MIAFILVFFFVIMPIVLIWRLTTLGIRDARSIAASRSKKESSPPR